METDHENNDVYFSNVVEVLLSRQNCSPFLQLVNQVASCFFLFIRGGVPGVRTFSASGAWRGITRGKPFRLRESSPVFLEYCINLLFYEKRTRWWILLFYRSAVFSMLSVECSVCILFGLCWLFLHHFRNNTKKNIISKKRTEHNFALSE